MSSQSPDIERPRRGSTCALRRSLCGTSGRSRAVKSARHLRHALSATSTTRPTLASHR